MATNGVSSFNVTGESSREYIGASGEKTLDFLETSAVDPARSRSRLSSVETICSPCCVSLEGAITLCAPSMGESIYSAVTGYPPDRKGIDSCESTEQRAEPTLPQRER